MKFGIKVIKGKTLKTNIQGKVLMTQEDTCVVYRKFLFGLFRLYIQISPHKGWETEKEVGVYYHLFECYATDFDTREEAELLIMKFTTDPDKFVRYK